MAKKTATSRRRSAKPADDVKLDADIEVQAASEQVETAREQLRAAEAVLEQAREKAVQRIAWLKDKSAGELIDSSLEFVRKHPGLGVLTAASIGFLFARLFRR
ncbi:MAG: hypothetical protein QF918_09530 [Pirellulaceae bacterium]|jgi:ElaB/YqjD/DUF883 family membrane-anchored ribosome-binding protein|nr:hypothetical protein [Pirellulaceae bacterium]MDP6719676.1 hypothetical protein [Pirellulaceae bacterium]